MNIDEFSKMGLVMGPGREATDAEREAFAKAKSFSLEATLRYRAMLLLVKDSARDLSTVLGRMPTTAYIDEDGFDALLTKDVDKARGWIETFLKALDMLDEARAALRKS